MNPTFAGWTAESLELPTEFKIVIVLAAIYLGVPLIFSSLTTILLTYIAKKYAPKSAFNKKLVSPGGFKSFAMYLFVTSILITVVSARYIWPFFESISSDFIGNSLFCLAIGITSIVFAFFLFSQKKISTKS